MFSEKAFNIFEKSIIAYHIKDDVNQDFINPYQEGIEKLLDQKNWSDTAQ